VAAAVVAAGGRALVASAGGRMAGALARAGGELIVLPAQSKNPLVIAANAHRLTRIIRAEGVSLVHARSRAPAISALWAARATQTPFVATYHGVYEAHNAVKRWYNSVMTRGALTIANSAYTREHVIAEHRVDPDTVVAIARGVDLRRFDPGVISAQAIEAMRAAWGMEPGETRPVLLLAGRLTRWKGQTLAIEALAGLKDEGLDAILVLLGDDQGRVGYAQELKALAEKLGLEDAVRFPGHETNMPVAYLAADLVLAPSIKPEAFGRTAVEPQVMGRPVLAAAHGAATETVIDGQTGWLVEPGSPEAWARAVGEAIAAGPELLADMGAGARIRASALYSLEAMAAKTLAVYSRLLAGRPA